ncbi:MAG TPA: hypothetical protein VF834_06845 [Streptosporangiaceae bacterium]
MARPSTASRDRQDSPRVIDLRDLISRAATLPDRVPLTAVRSARPLRFVGPHRGARAIRPAVPAAPAGALPGLPMPRRVRPDVSAPKAIAVLIVITVTCVALTWAAVSVVDRGLAAGNPGSVAIAGPLAAPAPRVAGLFPRRYGKVPDPAEQHLIDEFGARFYVIATGSAGSPAARGSAASVVRPSGLYGEPGHIDPATGRPAWIMYLGLGSSRMLGAPASTMARLMGSLLGPASQVGYWHVRAGARGGSTDCTVAVLDQVPVSVCAWTTERTAGAVMSPLRDTTVAELAVIMVTMRYSLQTG